MKVHEYPENLFIVFFWAGFVIFCYALLNGNHLLTFVHVIHVAFFVGLRFSSLYGRTVG